MRHIYFFIALLVLYGDLLKRNFTASISLVMIYGVAVLLLFAIVVQKRKARYHVSAEGKVVFKLTVFLMLLYILQLLTSFSSSFADGLSHTLYICIPLLYIAVIYKYCPQFDLLALGKAFLFLMIPVNMVGTVQYFVDPTFMISTAYGDELGGVILRNFLGERSFFSRYPSLFASADRYSAMGLMQFFFTLIILKGGRSFSRKDKSWLTFNLISAGGALFIAGARSRILIAGVALTLMALAFMFSIMFSVKGGKVGRILKRYLPLLVGAVVVAFIVFGNWSTKQDERLLSFPVLNLLAQSVDEGDIGVRVEEATSLSRMLEDATFFGQGLGSIANGKPGEFGIRSMWIESGYIWGGMMVLTYLSIIVALTLLLWRSFMSFDALSVAIYCIPVLWLVFAVLAGLTSAFELSTGVLLGCAIAVISRTPRNITGGYIMPLPIQRNLH